MIRLDMAVPDEPDADCSGRPESKQLWDQVVSPPWSWDCSPTELLLN